MAINRLHSKQEYKGTTIFRKQREENASTNKHTSNRDKGTTTIFTFHSKTRETQTTFSTTASPSFILKNRFLHKFKLNSSLGVSLDYTEKSKQEHSNLKKNFMRNDKIPKKI